MTLSQTLKPGDALPEADHVLRYIRKKFVDNAQIDGNGFLSRPSEKDEGPSVNWMEYYSGNTANQIAEIRKVKRMKYERNGRIAKLHIGTTKRYLLDTVWPLIDCIYDPLPSEDNNGRKPADPSHACMKGIPVIDTPEGDAIRDLLVHCIVEHYPVVPD